MSTDCSDVLRRLDAYLDGELPERERVSLEEHVADCAPCLDRQEFRRALQRVVRDACGRATMPAGLLERIRGALGR